MLMSALNWEFVDNGKLGAVVVFLLQGTEAEEILGCFGENGETEGGGKELTFTYMEKKGIFS